MLIVGNRELRDGYHDDTRIHGFFNTDTHNYRWLSNYHVCPIITTLFGVEHRFSSSEAAYQASKCSNPSDVVQFVNLAPGKTKRLGQTIRVREDWEDVKIYVMHNLLCLKFNVYDDRTPENNVLKDLLIATADRELVETNWWGDVFWGQCGGVGQNHLGKILMEIQSILISKV